MKLLLNLLLLCVNGGWFVNGGGTYRLEFDVSSENSIAQYRENALQLRLGDTVIIDCDSDLPGTFLRLSSELEYAMCVPEAPPSLIGNCFRGLDGFELIISIRALDGELGSVADFLPGITYYLAYFNTTWMEMNGRPYPSGRYCTDGFKMIMQVLENDEMPATPTGSATVRGTEGLVSDGSTIPVKYIAIAVAAFVVLVVAFVIILFSVVCSIKSMNSRKQAVNLVSQKLMENGTEDSEGDNPGSVVAAKRNGVDGTDQSKGIIFIGDEASEITTSKPGITKPGTRKVATSKPRTKKVATKKVSKPGTQKASEHEVSKPGTKKASGHEVSKPGTKKAYGTKKASGHEVSKPDTKKASEHEVSKPGASEPIFNDREKLKGSSTEKTKDHKASSSEAATDKKDLNLVSVDVKGTAARYKAPSTQHNADVGKMGHKDKMKLANIPDSAAKRTQAEGRRNSQLATRAKTDSNVAPQGNGIGTTSKRSGTEAMKTSTNGVFSSGPRTNGMASDSSVVDKKLIASASSGSPRKNEPKRVIARNGSPRITSKSVVERTAETKPSSSSTPRYAEGPKKVIARNGSPRITSKSGVERPTEPQPSLSSAAPQTNNASQSLRPAPAPARMAPKPPVAKSLSSY